MGERTVSVRYNKEKHRTEFTVRENGQVVEQGSTLGQASSAKIKRVIRSIKDDSR